MVVAALEMVRVAADLVVVAKAGVGVAAEKEEAMVGGYTKYESTLWWRHSHTPCHSNCLLRLQYTASGPALDTRELPRSMKLMMDQ